MASEEAHVRLAVRNQGTITHLLQDTGAHAEWITTVAFYKALHVIEAIFSKDPSIKHGTSHRHRADCLKREGRFSHIWKFYRPLWAASTVARYLKGSGGKDYGDFADYLPPDQVESQILRHYLRQIEKSAANFLSKEAQNVLKSAPTATPTK